MKTFKEIRTPSINPNDKEEITASKKVPKGYHRMPDGSIMKDSDHPKESVTVDKIKRIAKIISDDSEGQEKTEIWKHAPKKIKQIAKVMTDGNIEDTEEGVSPAQRRARKAAYLKKTMAKYRQAAKMGIPASQVNQRRSHPTRKKS
jgi:hypothetical protein